MTISPGETLLKQDPRNHLWIVLSHANAAGEIAMANLTTHLPEKADHRSCLIVRPGEHPWVQHDSCVRFREAQLRPLSALAAAKALGELPQREECTPALPKRVQIGILESQRVPHEVRDAIRATLDASA